MKRKGYLLMEVILAMGIFLLCTTYLVKEMVSHNRIQEELKKEAELQNQTRYTGFAKQSSETLSLAKEEVEVVLGEYTLRLSKNKLENRQGEEQTRSYIFLDRREED